MPGSWCAVVIAQKKCVIFLISLLLAERMLAKRKEIIFAGELEP